MNTNYQWIYVVHCIFLEGGGDILFVNHLGAATQISLDNQTNLIAADVPVLCVVMPSAVEDKLVPVFHGNGFNYLCQSSLEMVISANLYIF